MKQKSPASASQSKTPSEVNQHLPQKLPSRIFLALLALIWGIVAFFIASLLIGILVNFLPFVTDTPLWTTIVSALVYILGVFLAVYFPGKVNKAWASTRHSLGLDDLPTWLDIGLAIAGYIILLLASYLLNQIFIAIFPWYDPSQAQDVGYNNIYGFADRLIAFFALVVVAPVAEEVLFRGYIYGRVRRYLPLIPAILLVSIAFGLMHGQWNVGLTTFTLSFILCLQREITNTIYSGIILHMLNNALAFVVLFL